MQLCNCACACAACVSQVLTAKLDFKSKPWPDVSEAAKDCVRSMLVRDPSRRATAQQILDHPWVKEGSGAAPARAMQPEVLTRLQQFAAMNKLKQEVSE